MQVKATVNAVNLFPELARDMTRLAREATEEGARAGAQAAAQIASQRGIGPILPGRASGSADGWEAAFVSAHRATWWQSMGTLGNRRRPLKQAPRTNRTRAPGTGIVPLNFLLAGRSAGRRALLDHIARGLPR